MATQTVYGNTSDGHIDSTDGAAEDDGIYSDARNGTGNTFASDTTSTTMSVGQWKGGFLNVLYGCYIGGLSFTNTLTSGDTITAVDLSLYLSSDYSTTDFTIRLRAQNWGSTLTTGDWTTSFSSTLLATKATSGIGAGYNAFTSESAFTSNVTKGGTDYWMMSSSLQEANTAPSGAEYVVWAASDNSGTAADPKLVITYTPATPPTITSGPTTTYASGTATTPTVTWGVTFTATDAEQTGSDALTYYIRTSSTFGGGTQVATGTCTSGASKVLTGLAYNASGLVEGSQTLYLHIYDGALNTVTAGSFNLVVSTTKKFRRALLGVGF